MSWFKKEELTFEEVIKFLEDNQLKIDDIIAEKILNIIVKSKTNKILHYRISE